MSINTKHPSFPQPDNINEKVWRYMSLEQLVSILHTRKLHLARLDSFKDKLEGSTPAINHQLTIQQINSFDLPIDAKTKLLTNLTHSIKAMRYTTYASCWHLKHEESFPMWQLYGGSNDRNIAIQTTYQKLSASKIDLLGSVFIGKITYVNYKTDIAKLNGNLLSSSMHKHIAYKHEDEVRIIHCPFLLGSPESMQVNNPKIVSFDVDLNSLIERIYVNPEAPSWYFDVIKSAVQKYEEDISISWSDLRSDVFF